MATGFLDPIPQQMPQKQQSKTQVTEVFLKELNELRSRVKK